MFELRSLLMLPLLAGLTVVMGMDNILSVAVISSGVEPALRTRARVVGLGLAFLSRLLVLCTLLWALRGAHVQFTLVGHPVVLRDLLKLAGGAFLIYKSLTQILQPASSGAQDAGSAAHTPLRWAVLQILFADQVQSMDSLVTVVGIAPNVVLMILAILIELTVILFFSMPVAALIARYPSLRTLAVCALLLVGATLISEGIEMPIPRTYVYSMMAYALFVEVMNVRLGQRQDSGGRMSNDEVRMTKEARMPE